LLVRFYEKVAPEKALDGLISTPSILAYSLEARINPRYRYTPFRFRGECVYYEALRNL
jgi:hypothetical protein